MSAKIKILIVEHDPHDLELMHDELKSAQLDYIFQTAHNEVTFRKALLEFTPDIILADFTFPSFDGPAAFDIKKELTPDIPFIFVSGSIGEERSIELIKNGLTDYVLKDKLFTLTTKVKRALKETKQQQLKVIADRELAESEKQYRRIVETAQEGIWVIDENGRTTYVNKKMCEIIGYDEKEMIGRTNLSFKDAEGQRDTLEKMERRRKGISESHESSFITKSGENIFVWVTTNAIFDDAGVFKGALAMISDITERRKTEQNNNFRSQLLNRIGQAVIATDLSGSINYWNNAASEIYGWTYAEAIGKNVVDLIPAKIAQKEAQEIMAQLSGGNTWSGEFIAQRRDGKDFPVFVTDTPFYDRDNKLTGMIGVSTDITERKKTEQEIAWLINNTEESFILLNEKIEIISFNDRAQKLYSKYLLRELVKGDCILDYAQPHRYSQVKKIYKRVLAGAVETDEIIIPLADGSVKNFALKYKPAINEYDQIIGAFVSAIDITDKKETELQLVINERRYRALVENGADGLAIISAEGKAVYVSPTVKKILGYTDEEIMALDIFSLFHPDDITVMGEVWKLVMESPGTPISGHTGRMLHKNGSWRWLEATVTNMLHDPSIKGIVDNFRDVTEKIEAERLQEFERRDKEALINSTTDLMWSVSSDFKLVAANRSFIDSLEKFNGIIIKPGDEILLKDKLPAGYIEFWEELYIRALAGESFTNEIHFPVSETQRESWGEISFNPIYDKDVITGIACYSRDTTASMHFKNELISINKKLETAQQIAQLGYWESYIDPADTLYWSDEVYNIWGVSRDSFEVSFTNFRNTIHPDDKGLFDAASKKAMNGEEKLDMEHRIILPDGSVKWVHEKGELIYNEKKEAIRLEGTVQNITEQKKHREAAIAVLSEKNIILESIGDGFFAVDKNFIVTYWNNLAEKMLGKKTEATVGQQLWDIFPESVGTASYKNYSLAFENNRIIQFEDFYPPLDKWYEISAYPSLNGLSVYFKDISERKLSEIKLNELNTSLQQNAKELALSNAELEQFAYVASHDLQEPLRMVTSFLAMLEKKYGDLIDDKGKQYIAFAVDGAKRMKQIILDLLDFSRVGSTKEKSENVDPEELMAEMRSLFQKEISEEGAIILSQDLPVILANKSSLFRVFQNLIGNALKYRQKDVASKINISVTETVTHWQFAVEDNGIGIEEEYFDKIFVIFQRLHNLDEFSGTGMGLAITKKIIENHGGKIWLTSEEGKGSIFYFTLLKQS